jgi:hypothetical protein
MSGSVSSVLESIGRAAYRLSFEASPIILQGGIAGAIGGYLPIIALTEALNFATGLLSGAGPELTIDNMFAHFRPIAGSTLIANRIGKYTFANQTVAANAIIADPLHVSLLMVCPAKGPGGIATKLATMIALQKTLQLHSVQGGTYIVVTPSGYWPNAILLSFTDASSGDAKNPQETWKLDFEQPLITLQQAAQVQNQLMSQITNGLPTDGSTSGPSSIVDNPASGGAAATQPVSSDLTGTSTGANPGINPYTGAPTGPVTSTTNEDGSVVYSDGTYTPPPGGF